MKTMLLLALFFTVMLWPLYLYANRDGQPADDWSSSFPFIIDFFVAAACWIIWLLWVLIHYLVS